MRCGSFKVESNVINPSVEVELGMLLCEGSQSRG